MTQNYDTSTEYDVSITNLKIVTAFLAAILISETFYWGLKIQQSQSIYWHQNTYLKIHNQDIKYCHIIMIQRRMQCIITNYKIVLAILAAILSFWTSYWA